MSKFSAFRNRELVAQLSEIRISDLNIKSWRIIIYMLSTPLPDRLPYSTLKRTSPGPRIFRISSIRQPRGRLTAPLAMPGAGGEDCGRKRAMSDRKEKLTYLIGNQTPERAPRRRPIAGRRLAPSPGGRGRGPRRRRGRVRGFTVSDFAPTALPALRLASYPPPCPLPLGEGSNGRLTRGG